MHLHYLDYGAELERALQYILTPQYIRSQTYWDIFSRCTVILASSMCCQYSICTCTEPNNQTLDLETTSLAAGAPRPAPHEAVASKMILTRIRAAGGVYDYQ
jgi:hypothetical protein